MTPLPPPDRHNLSQPSIVFGKSFDAEPDIDPRNVYRRANLATVRPTEIHDLVLDFDDRRVVHKLRRHKLIPIDSTKHRLVEQTFCAFHKSEQLRLIPYRGETGREWTEKVAA